MTIYLIGYEYAIFSDVLRKNNIPRYIDNRENYGFLTFDENINHESSEALPECGVFRKW